MHIVNEMSTIEAGEVNPETVFFPHSSFTGSFRAIVRT